MRASAGGAALVAGASGGIGRAVARALAREGVALALVARSRDALNEIRVECAEYGVPALSEPTDITNSDDVARVLARAEAELGRVEVLVNAAAIHGPIGRADQCDPVSWRRAVEVNLYGSYLLCRAVAPGMFASGGGRIVLFAGGGATSPRPGFSAYAASKAGVVRLAETLATELRPHVQVNAVAPGLVDTALLDDVLLAGPCAGADYEKVRALRAGELEAVPTELVAELAVFLALDADPALTGRLISALHDPWREWADAANVPQDWLYTLRRLDAQTLDPLLEARS